ncbi:MAG: alpha/beta fold hydrolase [Tissierellia bacterium]|nr:alpha/beta fold hydrolase [Tissierellia bacterium]
MKKSSKKERHPLGGVILAGLLIPQMERMWKKDQGRRNTLTFLQNLPDPLYALEEGGEEKVISGYVLSPVDGLPLKFRLYEPERAKGIVHIIHGAQEYSIFYHEFALWLRDHGYLVLTSDNRGHGDSVDRENPRGHISSLDDVVTDHMAMTLWMKKQYPHLKYHLFGHSFGSLIARTYLQQYDELIDSLILTGTVNYRAMAKLGIFVGNIEGFYGGLKGRGPFVRLMDGATKADPKKLSGNEKFLRDMARDPKVIENYPASGALAIWESVARLKNGRNYQRRNPGLPILSLTGSLDPVAGYKMGTRDTEKTFLKLGYWNYASVVYEGLYHDLIHEEKHGKMVHWDILNFLDTAALEAFPTEI